MILPNAEQLRAWDAYTIEHQNINSLGLMERAAQQCTQWILSQHHLPKDFLVVCGKGNNGGDGLAIARQLSESGLHCRVIILEFDEKESFDFKANLSRLKQTMSDIVFLGFNDKFPTPKKDCTIIDAMFGFGLSRPVAGRYLDVIETINQCGAPIISIDVPSGMYIDKSSTGNTIVKATETLTFQVLKLCFLLAENAPFMGNVHVLPIGLDPGFISQITSLFNLTDHHLVSSFYRERIRFSHKGTYGHALLIAGNKGKMGAAIMCAKSCLRSGVGLLTCSVPEAYYDVLHSSVPEAMMLQRGEEKDLAAYRVIGIGPGLGTGEEVAQYVHSVFTGFDQPMVVDADALNIVSKQSEWLPMIPKQSVLTPHPKEFDRLFGDSKDEVERINKAIVNARQLDLVIVLKGTHTLVTDGNRNFFNSTGNNGMATGGSGDTLTGMITALLSQQYPSFEAAVLGVYLHGLAADLCLEEQSYESLLPTDMIEKFGKAFNRYKIIKGLKNKPLCTLHKQSIPLWKDIYNQFN